MTHDLILVDIPDKNSTALLRHLGDAEFYSKILNGKPVLIAQGKDEGILVLYPCASYTLETESVYRYSGRFETYACFMYHEPAKPELVPRVSDFVYTSELCLMPEASLNTTMLAYIESLGDKLVEVQSKMKKVYGLPVGRIVDAVYNWRIGLPYRVHDITGEGPYRCMLETVEGNLQVIYEGGLKW